MQVKRKRLGVLAQAVAAEDTRKFVGKLLAKLDANKAGKDGKRAYTTSHNPAVREIAGGQEVLRAVLESLHGQPENLTLMLDIINEE